MKVWVFRVSELQSLIHAPISHQEWRGGTLWNGPMQHINIMLQHLFLTEGRSLTLFFLTNIDIAFPYFKDNGIIEL